MKLIILGPPGSGKGTISERLENEFGFLHLSAGELLRAEAAKGTPHGQKIKNIIESGKLVPNELIVKMIKEKIKGKRKFILDGFPRSVEQVKSIEDLKLDLVINITVPEEVIVERIAGRRVCKGGHHGYHLKYLPPKKAGFCDVDGAPLIQRKDDTPEVIKNRFKVYYQETEPVVGHYQKKGILRNIDGSGTPEEVYEEVKKVLY